MSEKTMDFISYFSQALQENHKALVDRGTLDRHVNMSADPRKSPNLSLSSENGDHGWNQNIKSYFCGHILQFIFYIQGVPKKMYNLNI